MYGTNHTTADSKQGLLSSKAEISGEAESSMMVPAARGVHDISGQFGGMHDIQLFFNNIRGGRPDTYPRYS
jgi:hypothetical protein